jgi:hypothetical protein
MDPLHLTKRTQSYKIYGRPVTWRSPDGLVHACAGQTIPSDDPSPSYVLWTFCSLDLHTRFSFELIKSRDVTCYECLQQSKPTMWPGTRKKLL